MIKGLGLICKRLEGEQSLAKLNDYLEGKKFSGYLQTRLPDDNGTEVGGVSIYRAGEPIIAYTFSGNVKTIDPGQRSLSSMMSDKSGKTEIFTLSEYQLQSVCNTFREYSIETPGVRDNGLEQQKSANVETSSIDIPDMSGKFVKAITVDDLKKYLTKLPIDTGHLTIDLKGPGGYIEYHLLIVYGQVLGAKLGSKSIKWPDMLEGLSGKSGVVEIYRFDEPMIKSIFDKYPAIVAKVADKTINEPPGIIEKKTEAIAPEPPKPEPIKDDVVPEPAKATAIEQTNAEPHAWKTIGPAKEVTCIPEAIISEPKQEQLIDGTAQEPAGNIDAGYVAADHIKAEPDKKKETDYVALPKDEKKHPDAADGTMAPATTAQDEMNIVKDIEQDFLSNVDEILNRLKLTHLRYTVKKNKEK